MKPVRNDWPVRLGQGRICRAGQDVTIVTWGNCVSLALTAAEELSRSGIAAEVIDLRTLCPCDWGLVRDSISRTHRLVVVQEDSRTSSFGQAIISEMVRDPATWDCFLAPPQLLSREDVHVPFHAALEREVLPKVADVVGAVASVLKYC